MKIQLCDKKHRQPLPNRKIQLQVQGKHSGFVTIDTDHNGWFYLDEKYKKHDIAIFHKGKTEQFESAREGLQLLASESMGFDHHDESSHHHQHHRNQHDEHREHRHNHHQNNKHTNKKETDKSNY